MLYKISEFNVETLSVSNSKNATYLQSNNIPFEIQVDWITLGKYPLPSKKYVTDDAKSLNLTIPISKDDENYRVLSAIDEHISKLNLSQNKKYHTLVSEKDHANGVMGAADDSYYLKFKLYLDTALFDKDKNRISITSLFDFYQYFKEDTQIKIVFSFSKIWRMSNEYGFSMSVRRILLKDKVKEIHENKISFLDDN